MKIKETFVAIHIVYFFSYILGAELKQEMFNEQTIGYREEGDRRNTYFSTCFSFTINSITNCDPLPVHNFH